MSADIRSLYTTHTLSGVINNVTTDPRFFLKYFPYLKTHSVDYVMWDETQDSLLITPYAHPSERAPVIQKEGFKSHMLRTAYLKEKREFNPEDATTRIAGEKFGGGLSNLQRHQLNVAAALKSQRELFERRLEQMASEIMTSGRLNVVGKDFAHTVDFNKSTDLVNKSTDWSDDTIDIGEQFEEWSQAILDNSGGSADTILFGRNAWKLFKKNKSVKDMLELRKADISTLKLSPEQAIDGLQFKGTYGEFKLAVHLGKYTDPKDGITKSYIDDDSILMISPAVRGTRHFGVIRDLDADIKSLPYFTKRITVDDPSAMYLLSQSAPLLTPEKVNATMYIKVKPTSSDSNNMQPSTPSTNESNLSPEPSAPISNRGNRGRRG